MLEGRHGARVVQRGRDVPRIAVPPYIGAGFTQLDALTGCNGVPVGHVTLLTGKTTSGKLTIAYKILEQAQGNGRHKSEVAILDLTRLSDWDYIARCGVDLAHALVVCPPHAEGVVELLFDLLRGYGLHVLLVDGLGDLLANRAMARASTWRCHRSITNRRRPHCALICLDEPQPPWLRWLKIGSTATAHVASLHVELRREQWLKRDYNVVGYVARAHLIKSRWAKNVAITINDTVKTSP